MIEMNENRQTNETIQTIELGVKEMFQMLTYLSLVWFKMFETLKMKWSIAESKRFKRFSRCRKAAICEGKCNAG